MTTLPPEFISSGDQPFKMRRGKTFTEEEKFILYHCMLPDLDIIDNKCMDSITVVRKADAWRRVTLKFNSDPRVVPRTTEQLKKCFENAKCRKQWVAPNSITGRPQQITHSSNILLPTDLPTTLQDIFHNTANIGDIKQETDENLECFPEVHSNTEQQHIKYEIVDMSETTEDIPDDPSAVVEVQAEPTRTNLRPRVSSSQPRSFAGHRSTETVSDNCDPLGTDDHDDSEDQFSADTFVGLCRSNITRVYGSSTTRKRLKRSVSCTETAENPETSETLQGETTEALEVRLLKAQVREAEAAASAAEAQLQLNKLALQHAQAEEVRRQQLHRLRIRRLAQLIGTNDESTEVH